MPRRYSWSVWPGTPSDALGPRSRRSAARSGSPHSVRSPTTHTWRPVGTRQLQPDDIDTVIGLILVDALGRSDAGAQAVHEQLRALLVRQLDDELHDTGPLVQAFRGRLDA